MAAVADGAEIQFIVDAGENPRNSCLIRAAIVVDDSVDLDRLFSALKGKVPQAVRDVLGGTGLQRGGAFDRMLENVLPLTSRPHGTGGVADTIVMRDHPDGRTDRPIARIETQIFLHDGVDAQAVFTLLKGCIAQKDVTLFGTVLSNFGLVSDGDMLKAMVAAALNVPIP